MADWRGLPSGYTQVEYIESSGTQYIDTGFVPNQDTRVVAEMAYANHTDATCGLFGARSNSTTVFEAFYYQGYYRFLCGSADSRVSADSPASQKMLIDVAQERATYDVNGTTINVTPTTAANFTITATLFIHALNRGSENNYSSLSRTYTFKIYDNGTLVRDFVPCVNASGAVGLYDMVGGTFYTNAGTETFMAGDVVEQPIEPDEPDIAPDEPLEPDSPADWTTPKTDWTAQDWFNIEDYHRITGNIAYLHEYAQALWPAFEMGGTVAADVGKISSANMLNFVEDDIQRLADNTFRLAEFEDGKTFAVGSPAWNWEDLNRIENNLLRLHYMLTGQARNRRTLAFELGGVQFG